MLPWKLNAVDEIKVIHVLIYIYIFHLTRILLKSFMLSLMIRWWWCGQFCGGNIPPLILIQVCWLKFGYGSHVCMTCQPPCLSKQPNSFAAYSLFLCSDLSPNVKNVNIRTFYNLDTCWHCVLCVLHLL